MATDELQTTPNNEESGIGKEIENISAVELSHKEIDVRDIKDCVMKVAEDFLLKKSARTNLEYCNR